jgi:membrane peptidoglycan carboxypeptidase
MSMGTTTSLDALGGPPAANRQPWYRRRVARIGIRAGQVLIVLVVVGSAAFGMLLLITPSVGNARQLAARIDQAHHAPYPGAAVPPRFAAALEATEDHRFNSEPGIDPIALGRFVLGQVAGKGDQGGATLYAQLAKLLYTPGDASIKAQLEQGALAVKLRFSYGPAEVLRLYSDVVYFGHGYYGLQDASCGYYGVPPDQMSWPQAALLAGLVFAPTADDPLTSPAGALSREEHVLGRLVATGELTQAQVSAYLQIPVRGLLAGRADSRC